MTRTMPSIVAVSVLLLANFAVAGEKTKVPGPLHSPLDASQYRIQQQSGSGSTYHALNPAHGIQTSFTTDGPRIKSNRPSESWEWGVTLLSYGCGERIERPVPATLATDGNRIEYRRGPVTEWYINDRHGLEQGFTVSERPLATAAPDRLRLRLAITGDLRPIEEAHGRDGVRFVTSAGQTALYYGALSVVDRSNRRLPASMHVDGRELVLAVDDRDAQYPLVIDPLVTSETKLTASDPAIGDAYGRSVAMSGDTAVVGAYLDDTSAGADAGSVYVYVRNGSTWSEQARLFANPAHAGDLFGFAVAISGDTLVVGAHGDPTGGSFTGSVSVFVRSGTTWSLQARLAGAAPSDAFGFAVAIEGDTMVVSAPTLTATVGAVHVYIRSGSTWTAQATLTADDGADGDDFGHSVALNGDTIVVGAFGDDVGTTVNAGSAYVFVRSGSTWAQQAHLTAGDAAATDLFGVSVAVSGDTIVVGSHLDDNAGGTDAGSAYVFERSGSTWTEAVQLSASNGSPNSFFGSAVALIDGVIAVGAPNADLPTVADAGAAYVFVRSGGTWSEQLIVSRSDAASDDTSALAYGTSLALIDGFVGVGAGFAEGAPSHTGAAYIYTLSTDLQIGSQVAPVPTVVAGQNVTYTLTVTNNGPVTASDVVVTDSLPASTTFVSCASDVPGVCGGTGNNRTITFASLAPGASKAITIVATVSCAASNGSVIANQAAVSADTADHNTANNSSSAQTTVANDTPVLTSSLAITMLAQNNANLVNVGFTAGATDTCPGVSLQVQVFGDEDDQTPTKQNVVHSPDAKDIAPNTLRLRSERVDAGDGRVYLVVARATDAGAGGAFQVHSVVVPKSQSQADINAVNNQAAAARAYAESHNGAPPPGFFVIGDGPVIGPKQ